ncbi:hypothetical protein [Aeoliella mucimassa]|nr:hypothetical protein [Aeoliella mucimassa]
MAYCLTLGGAHALLIPSTLATMAALLMLAIASRRAASGQIYAWVDRTPELPRGILRTDRTPELPAGSIWHSTADRAEPQTDMDETLVDVPVLKTSTGDDNEPRDDEVVLQHIVRMRDKDGREYIHATLRGEIAADQRHVTLYLGFCPPFPTIPQVEAEVIEGPAATTKVVQILHNGVQIDVELDANVSKSVTVVVEAVAYEADPTS